MGCRDDIERREMVKEQDGGAEGPEEKERLRGIRNRCCKGVGRVCVCVRWRRSHGSQQCECVLAPAASHTKPQPL